jgi:uncharacterized membrane protein
VERYWELDFLRGLSVVLMILFNWSYALKFLGVYSLFPGSNFLYWDVFPLFVAGSFMFIAGISLTLSWNRFKGKKPSRKEKWKKYGLRGLKIFGLGLGITAVTYLTFPDNFIFFGILHLLGLSIAVSPFVVSDPRKALAFSGLVLVLFLLPDLFDPSLVMASLGLSGVPFSTFDFFPLIPWSSVVFLGVAVGHWMYPGGERGFDIQKREIDVFDRFSGFVEFLGRNSLLIYLLHQPVLIGVLVLMGYPVF